MNLKYLAPFLLIFTVINLDVNGFTIDFNGQESKIQIVTDKIINEIIENSHSQRLLQTVQLSNENTEVSSKRGLNIPSPTISTKSIVPDTSTNTKISNTQFKGIILYNYIPAILSNKEYFEIKGRILSPKDNQPDSFIGFAFFSTTGSGRFDYIKHLEVGTTQFSILLNLKTIPEGQYQIGANVAWQWSNSTIKRTISTKTSILSLENSPETTKNLVMEVLNNKLYLSWNEDNKTAIDRLTFFQGNLTKQYVLTNFVSSFEIPFKDFYNFKLNSVTVKLDSATSKTQSLASRKSQYSIPLSLNFTPSKHLWSQFQNQYMQFDEQIPWQFNQGQSLHLKGIVLNNLKNKIVVEQPTKTFKTYYFSQNEENSLIQAYSSFDLNISFPSVGNYVIEILDQNGETVLNRPAYVGNAYPLLPDYVDLAPEQVNQKTVSNGQPNTLQKQRTKLLQLINSKRQEYGTQSVQLDDQLNFSSKAFYKYGSQLIFQ